MPIIFITGMSGTGKTTAIHQLVRRGYKSIDTDEGEWTGFSGDQPLWKEPMIEELVSSHEQSGEPLFLTATVINQAKFYHRFDEIVLFSAPVEVMTERIASRGNNPFGKSDNELARILADTEEFEPVLRSVATVEIDTRKSVDEIVDQLVSLMFPDLLSSEPLDNER
jgi:dephospho-CoA kinase